MPFCELCYSLVLVYIIMDHFNTAFWMIPYIDDGEADFNNFAVAFQTLHLCFQTVHTDGFRV